MSVISYTGTNGCSLFVLTLQQKGSDGSMKTGKLNLADLAGMVWVVVKLLIGIR